jgi:hypothetical protein
MKSLIMLTRMNECHQLGADSGVIKEINKSNANLYLIRGRRVSISLVLMFAFDNFSLSEKFFFLGNIRVSSTYF